MNAGPRRLFAAVVAVLGMAVLAPCRLGEHRRHHRPVGPARADGEQRLAGRDLHERTARNRRSLLGRDTDAVLRTGLRPPQWGFTQFIVKHTTEAGPLEKPVGEVKTVRVDLPVGLSVNPGATERCPLATFRSRRSAATRVPRLARSAKASSRRRWPASSPRRPNR